MRLKSFQWLLRRLLGSKTSCSTKTSRVILDGVPGAGGYDAIFAITLGDSGRKLTQAWSSHNVLALLVKEDPHGVCLESGDPRTTGITLGVSSIHVE
ncbi:hypothetical protein F2Q68_00016626 [Brassica cretica]|uniref:GHMP kinase C-terminal domain-containing protein n=1 Tax=Brassica cretica TaxID=69181 RepID=A0A8S9HHW2_BRACR|nr:hypothetical protein F2Q68_00016626 [Brassica cretica]